MKKAKLIELWKPDCPDCEAAKPIVAELEAGDYEIEKRNIVNPDGRALWEKYEEEIDAYSQSQGWEAGYIYTPTFINPQNGKALSFADRAPTKEELVKFATSS